MSITMEELAKLANVSQGAVSLVLNGKAKGQISQKKQDLIRALAKEHNYRINMAAKGLRKQRQYAVGVMLFFLSTKDPFSICPFVYMFNKIDQCLIGNFHSACGGVIAGKIPVAGMVRQAFLQVFAALINNCQF